MVLTDDERKKRARESLRRYREKNPEKILENARRRRRENLEKAREKERRWREKNPEKLREAKRRYNATEKGREANRIYARKWRATNPERNRDLARNWARANIEKVHTTSKRYRAANREKLKEEKKEYYRKMSQNPAWLIEKNRQGRKHYHKNIEKQRVRGKRYREENKQKTFERHKKYRESERGKENYREWRADNPELVRYYANKSRKKNPRADTEIMKIYRRSHRECEWSGCDRSSGTVHHILPQFKYPAYVDGDYHGRVGNNFICYCVFHHHAYHYARATIRKEKKHNKLLSFLWSGSDTSVTGWAEENKIPISALEIELDLMFVGFGTKNS